MDFAQTADHEDVYEPYSSNAADIIGVTPASQRSDQCLMPRADKTGHTESSPETTKTPHPKQL